jgi:hypothetical protein
MLLLSSPLASLLSLSALPRYWYDGKCKTSFLSFIMVPAWLDEPTWVWLTCMQAKCLHRVQNILPGDAEPFFITLSDYEPAEEESKGLLFSKKTQFGVYFNRSHAGKRALFVGV